MNRVVQAVWAGVRLPVAAALLVLEPVVRWVCSVGLVLGVLACTLFELSAAGPRFPLVKMLAVTGSFGVVLFLYYGLVSLFVKD